MSASRFFQRFRRVTDSTRYLPEVDGIRFIAVFAVVVIMHTSNFIDIKFFDRSLIRDPRIANFVLNGGMGVSLFFVVSGFILSLPFARWRFGNQDPVSLKRYYLRRLTRLEPPYLVALVLLFIIQVWVLHRYSFEELWPRFLASSAYLHTLIYDSHSWVLPVAWTLEVEVQFYLLAPLFFLVFCVRQALIRFLIYGVIIFTGAIVWFDVWGAAHVFMYLQFFFMGILLADLRARGVELFRSRHIAAIAGWMSLAGFLFINGLASVEWMLLKMVCMFVLFHAALAEGQFKQLLSKPLIATIGGMCYSIYLWHFAVIAALGLWLMQTGFVQAAWWLVPVYFLILVAGVLFVSAVFFLWVEKPFMKLRMRRRSEPS